MFRFVRASKYRALDKKCLALEAMLEKHARIHNEALARRDAEVDWARSELARFQAEIASILGIFRARQGKL